MTLESVAGTYFFCAGMGGREIKLGVDGSCSNGFGSCLSSGSANGKVRVEDSRLVMEALSVDGKPTGRTCVFIPIWWRGRVYLVGESGEWMPGGLVELCNAINWGEEPHAEYDRKNLEHIFTRVRKDAKPDDKDGLPKEMEAMILKEEISGEILEPGKAGATRVNFGSKKGAYKGMRVLAGDESHYGNWLRLVEVGEETSVLANYFTWQSGPLPKPGTPVRCEARGFADPKGK